MRVVMLPSMASRVTRAAMDSTTTTALGTIMGSWRPLIEISIFSPWRFTVYWIAATDGVGLKAARIRIGAPSLIPPVIPPEWFVFFITFPSWSMRYASLLCKPSEEAAAIPAPTSKDFTAPMEKMALARLASSFSKAG